MKRQLKKSQKGGSIPLIPVRKPTITLGQDNTRVVTPQLLDEDAVAKINADELKRRKLKLSNQKKIYKEKGELSKEALAASAAGEKTRFFPDDPNSFIDEYINPFKMIGDMADNLGRAFFDPNADVMDKITAVGIPLSVGALGNIGTSTNAQFVNNIVNPVAGIENLAKPSGSGFLKKIFGNSKQNPDPVKWVSNWNSDPINIAKQEAYANQDNALGVRKHFYPFRDVNNANIGNYFDLAVDKGLGDYMRYSYDTGGLSYMDGNVYINRLMPNKKSTIVHELTHNFEHNGASFLKGEKDELLDPFGMTSKERSNANLDKRKKYYTDPTEIHARMNEARYELGLKPGEEFTEKHYNEIMKKKFFRDPFFGMGKFIKDKDKMIKLMNNFYTPAAVATGAAAVASQENNYQYGGAVKPLVQDNTRVYNNVIPKNNSEKEINRSKQAVANNTSAINKSNEYDTANTLGNMFGNVGKYFFDIEDKDLLPSPYTPTVKSNKQYYKYSDKSKKLEPYTPDIKYYTRNGMKEDVFNDLTSKEVMKAYNHDSSFEDIHKALLNDGKDRKHSADKAFPNNQAGYKGMYNRGHGSLIGEFNLGRYTVGAGQDNKGRYVSFVDSYSWDDNESKKYPEYNESRINYYDRIYEDDWGDLSKRFNKNGSPKKQLGGVINEESNLLEISKNLSNQNPFSLRSSIYKPQEDKLNIKDNRKVNATSGKPINPNKDLVSGNYSTERINKLVHYSKLYNIDPYDLLAIDLQETGLGSSLRDGNENAGHVQIPYYDLKTPTKFNVDEQGTPYTPQEEAYDNFARAFLDKKNTAKNLGLNNEADIFQTYNGRGKVFSTTENDYHGFNMNSIYGVPLGPQGIDLRKNPLYGKRVIDLRDNVLKNSPNITDAVNTVMQNGGAISETGYLRDSPDRNNDYNIIPSNQITMIDVPHPVFGIDDLGNEQMMYPGNDYEFPGNYVTEYPMKKKKDGGIIKGVNKNFLEKYNIFNVENSPSVDMFDPTITKAQMGMQTPFDDEAIVPFYNYDPGIAPESTQPQYIPQTSQSSDPRSPSITNQGLNNMMNRASSNLMGELIDPGSFTNLAGYAAAGVNYFDTRRKERQQEDWFQTQQNTDNLYPVQSGDNRGDYVVNGSAYGQFRPDQLGAQSPYGMTGQYYPSMQMGGQPYTTPRGNVITKDDLTRIKENSDIEWDDEKQYGEWLDKFASPITTSTNTVKYPYGKRGETMTQDEWDYVRTQRGYPDVYSDGIDTQNFIPGEIYSNEVRSTLEKYRKQNMNTKMEYGGQSGFALDLNPRRISMTSNSDRNPISKTLQPVDEEEANIEAELGETIFGDFDNDGINEQMNIGGKKHYAGGTPIQAPPASFIFSDTKKLKIGGEILTEFGKSENTKRKYTPAQLAKQYDVNKYKAIIDDPDADPIKRRTAEMMISNYNNKLGQLALVQESKKGFPDGIPQVAIPYLMAQAGPEGLEGLSNIGGSTEAIFAEGGEYDPLVDPYKGGRTKKGTTTPTGRQNPYNRKQDHLAAWESIIPGISNMDNAKAQALMYQYNLTNNPESIKNMWGQYGLTAKGLRDKNLAGLSKNGVLDPSVLTPENLTKLQSAYTDGYFGARQMDPVRANNPQLPPLPPRDIDLTNPQPSTVTPPVSQIPLSTDPNEFVATQRQNAPTDFWTQDKINTAYALQNKANINKYLPWAAPIVGVTPDPTFYDPNRELAANAEMANIEMMYNNQFSGPQSVSARNSAVAGNSASNVANILGRYNNQNVGLANQFAAQDADITNQLSAQAGARVNNLYQGTVVANQQFDNAQAQAGDVIRKNLLGGLDNKQKTQWINTWYPQYNLDPASGYINFEQGSGRSSITPGGSAPMSYLETYKQLKRDNPDVSDEVLREQAKQMTGTATNRVNSDGDMSSTYKGPTPNLLQQLLQGR